MADLINFDFEKFNIGITPDDILNDAEQLIIQADEDYKNIANPFPVEIFPESIRQIINECNKSLNFPIDFIAASLIYAASVSIGNTYKVEIKKGFHESALLYLAIVARPGTNKSHPLSFALKPIIEKDNNTYHNYELQRQSYEKYLKTPKNNVVSDPSETTEKPFWLKSLLSDYTPEALVQVHYNNKRGVGIYADELAGWIKNFNRYNKGSEMEFWLSNWNNKPINIDRKTTGPIYIPMPFISVAGTIQTNLLFELAKDNRIQNGFIDRILFVIPDNIQKPCWSESEIDPKVIENWKTIISNLLTMEVIYDDTQNPIPEVIHFSPDAKALLYGWQKSITLISNESDHDILTGVYAKLEMYAARFALILELLKWACNKSDKQSISKVSVQSAIMLVEYFKISIMKVYSIITSINPLDKLPLDKQNLYHDLPNSFSTETGLLVAIKHNMPARNFNRFLTNKELFSKASRGQYEKLL